MGSPCELMLYLDCEEEARGVFDVVIGEITRLEQKYSRYTSDSFTTRINESAGICPIEVDEETALLLDYAATLHGQSDGKFDITSGVLRRAWNFKSGSLPSRARISELLPLVGWHKVIWRRPNLYLPIVGMEVDFGGYVKEYAADAAAAICQQLGIEHGLINLGGDIRALGPHPNGEAWQVGIQHPRRLRSAIASAALEKGAIATSGDYERYMIVDGNRYCHLLDPKTGWSIPTRLASISIIADQCIVAGSLATLAMLESAQNPRWLKTMSLPFLAIDQALQLQGSIDVLEFSLLN